MGDVKVHLVGHVHSCAVFGLSGFMDDVKVCLAVPACSCAVFGLPAFITLWGMSKCVLQSMCVVIHFWNCQDLSLDG